ncbi:DNA-binding MarR family transcriptional regulator [Bacillus sp. RC97]|uniref:MarR family transcriptional regulator n=1 Tax=Bacillus sp. RC97 TaxID=3156294 RepID=UPI0038392BBB
MSNRNSVGLELRTLVNLMRRQMNHSTCTILTERDNLTVMHGWAISYLCEKQDIDVFQKDFEREFSIRKSTASRILKSMENNGLIARLKKIVLTENAIKIHDSIMNCNSILEQRDLGRKIGGFL